MNACLLLALGSFSLLSALPAVAAPISIQPASQSLCFAENAGQWPAATRFSGSVPGATVEFRGEGMTCYLTRRGGPENSELESIALRVTFPGARPTPELLGEVPAPHLSHYYSGSDPAAWHTAVRNFGAVRYAALYPGIDLVYHGGDGQLEYDFELSPGADWKQIRLHYDGVERLAVTPAGDLSVTTRFGDVIERAPVAWQIVDGKRRPVRATYRLLDDNTFAFNVLDPLDPTAPLVIDPVLHYSTYLGGGSYDESHGIEYNAAGEAWVIGGTLSPDFPATGSPVPSTNYSVFITKLAANGESLLWSVFLGGSEDQIGYAIDVDANDNAFISGTTGSNDFPTTAGCYDATFNGTNPGEVDLFVARLSATGALLYSTYLGGTDSDTNSGLVLGPAGRVYVSGDAGSNYPTTAGCYDATQNGDSDVVLSILSLASLGPADLVYSTYLGGNASDESHGLAVDVAGNAYIGGGTRSSNFPAGGGPPFNGSFDAFLSEIQPAGAGPADLIYSQKFGGSGQDYGGAVAVDFIGVAFDGITSSTNFPTTSGAYQTTYGGGPHDGFVMFVLPSSNFVFYSTYLGGANADYAARLHMTFGGEITVSGFTNSPTFPTTAGAFDPTYNGDWDIFITRFDQAGANILESTFIGGIYADIPYDFKVDPLGRRYLTGNTQGAGFPLTATAYDTSYGSGAIDAFVLKFQPELPESCAACVSPPDTCCTRAPRFQGAQAPTLSSHILVGTREKSANSPYAVTIFDLGSPAPTEDVDWATVLRFNGPGNSWKADSLGSVFGLTLDEYGNIFVTHTSCYDLDKIGQIPGGGPGAIYRIDAVTGAMKIFCRLPNYPDPGIASPDNLPGLGNITYDCRHQQFFVTNIEDGRIYRIKPNGVNGMTGTIQDVFDPGVQDLGPTNYLAPLNTVPSPGWAPLGERLWGVQWHMDRVYYGVWAEDVGAPSSTIANEIRSVALNAAGAFIGSSDQHELFLPPLAPWNYSMPVSDISFHANGKMLLGERGITDETVSSPHAARSLEYGCEGGCWLPANAYQIGACCNGENCGGGIDYDNFAFTGGPIGRVWSSGDALHLGAAYTDELFGYQGSRPTGGSNLTAVLIDDDGNTVLIDKSFIGDVEAPGCIGGELGQICGQKYNDLNHNGVKDNGEPGMLGWTIMLNGPGGPYTAYTDEQGNFCFNYLLPGSYTLSEVGLPGWIQTAPAGGSYVVNLAAGQMLTGMDFGNYFCTTAPPCVTPPPGMGAWWSFDEAGGTLAMDVTHASPAKNTLQLFGGAEFSADGLIGNALHLAGASDYAVVQDVQQLGLDFETGSFAFDTWLNLNPGLAGPRMVAEKRTLISLMPYRTRGWALYLNGEQCFLEIGTSEVTETFAGPTITAGSWTHLAVSVDRVLGVGTWYVNGAPSPGGTFAPPAGSVFNNADLYVGRQSPAFGAGVPFDGWLDELEFFNSPLSAQSVSAIAAAGNGKCKEFCRVPAVTSFCKDKTTVTVCMNIVNNTTGPQSYHWSVAGLPTGPGCTVNGPITFSPAAGTVTVPAGGTSSPICVTITRPAGFTAQNATSCFAFSYVNDQTGVCRSCTGTLRADNSCWCVTPTQPGVVGVGQRFAGGFVGVPIGIGIKHPCPPIDLIQYSLTAVYEGSGDHPDPLAVSLNGLPPGEPVLGQLSLGENEEAEVSVLVTYPREYDPAGLYQIVMEADTDGDGFTEIVSCTPIASTYDPDPTSGVPVAPLVPNGLRLTAMPNPFQASATIAFVLPAAGDVDLAVYDLSGRRVRALRQGRLDAGTQNIAWDGRDDDGRATSSGIYFVRLQSGSVRLQTKLVKLR
ncbi:MAG: LamG-like jellyroll fold domain-containing protein [Candidatus Eisenbacteria bacterium]|nr:LamG-like jellyroll fold domain-containing protein [Candidatus Eisenbacteria bacterium]